LQKVLPPSPIFKTVYRLRPGRDVIFPTTFQLYTSDLYGWRKNRPTSLAHNRPCFIMRLHQLSRIRPSRHAGPLQLPSLSPVYFTAPPGFGKNLAPISRPG